jgi:hypothetical protein
MSIEKTKAEVLASRRATDQEAIVKATNPQNFRPIRYLIPGGATFRKTVDTVDRLTEVFYVYTRKLPRFTEFRFSFTREVDLSKYQRIQVERFERHPSGAPAWDVHPDRKMYLASLLTKALTKNPNSVALHADVTGVYAYVDTTKSFDDTSENWEPSYTITPDPAAYGQYGTRT